MPDPGDMRRYAWEQLASAEEVADDYGLGLRDSIQDAVEAVIGILGMKVRCAPLKNVCRVSPQLGAIKGHVLLWASARRKGLACHSPCFSAA